MATRLANNYLTAIIADNTTYGTQQTNLSGGLFMADVITEIKKDVMQTDTKVKTGTLLPKNTEKVITGTSATVTIKGNLCSEYALLLQAYTMDSSSPYTMQDTQPAGFSYNIYQLFAVGSSASDTPYNLALGCVLQDFKITGEANGIVQFDSTWRAKSMSRGITTTLTNEPTAYTAGTPFLVGNVTSTLFNSAAKLNSFGINFSKNYVDDRLTWQNSLTKTAEYLTGYTGTIDLETIYNDTNDPTHEGNIGSQSCVTNTISLVSSAPATWAIVCRCRIADFTLADADKSLFTSKYALDLAGDATAPLTITVS